jgi:hypothetical protein
MDPARGSPDAHTGVNAADRTRAIATAPSTADKIARESAQVGARRMGWLGLNTEWAQARREGRVTCRRGQGHQERRKAARIMMSARITMTSTLPGKPPEPVTAFIFAALVSATGQSVFEPTANPHQQDVATVTDADSDRLYMRHR